MLLQKLGIKKLPPGGSSYGEYLGDTYLRSSMRQPFHFLGNEIPVSFFHLYRQEWDVYELHPCVLHFQEFLEDVFHDLFFQSGQLHGCHEIGFPDFTFLAIQWQGQFFGIFGQSLQHASNSDMRSRTSIFQFFPAISSNHPSGIKPSKNGNNTLSW